MALTGNSGKFLNSNFDLSKWNAAKLGKIKVGAKVKRDDDANNTFVIDAVDIDWGGLAFNYLVTDENGNFVPKATKFSDDANEGKEQPIGIVSTGQLLDLIGKSLASLGRRVNLLTTSYIGDSSFLTTIENIIEEIKTGDGGPELLGTLIDKLKGLDGQTVKEYVDGKFNTVNNKLNIGNQTITQYVTNYVNSQLQFNGVEKYVTRDEFEAFAASLLGDELSYISDELSYISGAVNQQINTVGARVTRVENKVNNLHKVAKTGNYYDLVNKPTISNISSQLKYNYGFVDNKKLNDTVESLSYMIANVECNCSHQTSQVSPVEIHYDAASTTLFFNTEVEETPAPAVKKYTVKFVGTYCNVSPSSRVVQEGGKASATATPYNGYRLTTVENGVRNGNIITSNPIVDETTVRVMAEKIPVVIDDYTYTYAGI